MPTPSTPEELADLDQGLILITGSRRSGKTTTCEVILRCWQAQGANYRYFGHSPGLGRWAGPRGRYGGLPSFFSGSARCRGYSRILIDEPIHLMPEEVYPSGTLVLATSNPQTWMIQRASWIVRVNLPLIHIEQGQCGVVCMRPTLWERLLNGVGLEV